MLKRGWFFHLIRLAIGSFLVLLTGWLSGHFILITGSALTLYLAWQFYNSLRLYRWLQSWDNKPPESIGMWSDIFDRIAALQKQNIKRNEQYQQVIDDFEGLAGAFPDATVVIDDQGLIRWFNESAVKLLKLKVPADKGQAITNLIRETAFSDWLVIQDQLQSTLDIACPADDNISLQLSVVRFRKNQRLLILRDITDIRNLERMRHDLVANVSHELRTPLTVMLGYLEILKTQPEEPNPEAIKRMFKQAQQMNDMLEDLLELSRLEDTETLDGVSVDVPAMLAQLAEQAEDLSNGQHKITFKVEPGLNILGAAADLKSAFQNLVVNAINYTPEGGKIKVVWRESGNQLILSVTDSGVGIAHREIPRITERFYRVGDDRNRKTGGTGLGLAIVKHVLSTHNARLEVHSVLGKGSEFRCIFPSERKA
jgi:two-component system phosphate regulon sensor histidine kinase PhoR